MSNNLNRKILFWIFVERVLAMYIESKNIYFIH